MRVLVTPCGTEVGLEIWRSLHQIKDIELVGVNSEFDASSICFDEFIGGAPYADTVEYATFIVNLIKSKKIDFVIPAHDDATVALSTISDVLGATLICSPKRTVLMARSKIQTYSALNGVIRVPKVFENGVVRKFPVIVKPDRGQGSKGVSLCRNQEELHSVLKPGFFACEYLPGEEYTVDCFSDLDGKLIYAGPRQRFSVKTGIATSTAPVSDKKEFRIIAEKISKHVKFVGAWFFQLKRASSGELCLLEVAVRIAGSMALNRMQGINFPELSLAIHKKNHVICIEQEFASRMERSLSVQFDFKIKFDKLYIDFDDCIYMNKAILNIHAIAFIARCRNERRSVVLITRHEGDLEDTLRQLGIFNLFDDIIHIKDKSPKSRFIKDNSSIFIDDSFRERREVVEMCGIPVFGVDAIPSLVEAKFS